MSDYTQYTDEKLIEHLREGNDEIMDYLVNKYKKLVQSKARAMYLIGGETDDLIQEGMIGLYKAIRDYQPDREALFRTFAGLCIDRQLYTAIQTSNRQKNQPLNTYVSLSDEEWEGELRQLWEESPENILIERENAGTITKKIHEVLSPYENEVLSLYLKGYDYLQIAEILDKEGKSIDNALQRIRAKVKEFVQK